MILGIDATTLRGRLSGVGYYTSRLIDSLANGAGEGVLDKIVVLSNLEVALPPAERLEVHAHDRFRVRSLWMQFLLPGILKKVRPDLMHYTNYLAPVGGDTPYVLSIHDMSLQLFPECHTWKKRLLTSRLLPLAARRARLILTPSESTRNDVVRLLPVDPERVRMIPYAASPRFVRTEPDYARLERLYGVRAPYFLYVGTLEPRKNLPRLVRAFARVAGSLPDHQLVLVGQRGWKYQATLDEMARPELRGRVVMPGYVPEEDLPALISGAVAFVYPSLYEGFGLPVVEAMACGTPVLTTRTSSLAEIAEGAALLVDPKQEAGFADALVALASDPALREDLIARGRARAALYSWSRTGRETVAAYREALEGGAPKLSPATDADEAIRRSLAYASLFECPLTLAELHRSLMDVPLEPEELRRRIVAQAERRAVSLKDDAVFPPGREAWLALRAARRANTARLLARHSRALDWLARLPYVKLVALSGACAHDNAGDDDVDVLLVVRSGRLASVFLGVMIAAKLFGLRRSLCLNYALDDSSLALPERDLFTAAELAGMRPLAGRTLYRRFVAANGWALERYPNFAANYLQLSEDVAEAGSPRLERWLDRGGAGLFEPFARAFLRAYLGWRLRGQEGVRIQAGVLKLHSHDHRPRLMRAFAQAVGAKQVS